MSLFMSDVLRLDEVLLRMPYFVAPLMALHFNCTWFLVFLVAVIFPFAALMLTVFASHTLGRSRENAASAATVALAIFR